MFIPAKIYIFPSKNVVAHKLSDTKKSVYYWTLDTFLTYYFLSPQNLQFNGLCSSLSTCTWLTFLSSIQKPLRSYQTQYLARSHIRALKRSMTFFPSQNETSPTWKRGSDELYLVKLSLYFSR